MTEKPLSTTLLSSMISSETALRMVLGIVTWIKDQETQTLSF
jgi:hypothetical protein